MRRHILFDFLGGAPPVVVVAFTEDLRAGQRLDELQVRERLIHGNSPGDITGDQDRVRRAHLRAPVSLEPLHMIVPGRSENIHRLIDRQPEVQICDGKNTHVSGSFRVALSGNIIPYLPKEAQDSLKCFNIASASFSVMRSASRSCSFEALEIALIEPKCFIRIFLLAVPMPGMVSSE